MFLHFCEGELHSYIKCFAKKDYRFFYLVSLIFYLEKVVCF